MLVSTLFLFLGVRTPLWIVLLWIFHEAGIRGQNSTVMVNLGTIFAFLIMTVHKKRVRKICGLVCARVLGPKMVFAFLLLATYG